jgi:protein SCO1/2
MTVNVATPTLEQAPHHDQWSTWLLRLYYFLSAVRVIAVLVFNIFQPIKVLPRVSLAPGFTFTNQDGERRTSEDFRGKLTIYSFTYTGCVDDCPPTTSYMQALRDALVRSASANQDMKFALVTISVDPEHDTPAVLNTYAAPFLKKEQADNVSWDFLTGDALRTKYVVGGGFNVHYQAATNQAGRSSIKLNPRYVLVDGWGIVRAEYWGQDMDVQLLMRDIGYLVSEVRNSQGAARYAYEAIHLFACYH